MILCNISSGFWFDAAWQRAGWGQCDFLPSGSCAEKGRATARPVLRGVLRGSRGYGQLSL